MLARRYRLVRSEDFDRVRREGDCFAARHLVVCCRRNQGIGLRMGFAVSKKVGGAVVRNRVKRRLRESFRPLLDVIAPHWDLVVIARNSAADAVQSELYADIGRCLGRAGIFKAAGHVGS